VSLDLEEHDKSDPYTPMPEKRAEVIEALGQLRIAVASLPETHRLPLVRRYYSGLSEADIAQVIGIPMGTVKSRLHT
jgi:DNA-directed RNA polymerase specialized sigma24 family protein